MRDEKCPGAKYFATAVIMSSRVVWRLLRQSRFEWRRHFVWTTPRSIGSLVFSFYAPERTSIRAGSVQAVAMTPIISKPLQPRKKSGSRLPVNNLTVKNSEQDRGFVNLRRRNRKQVPVQDNDICPLANVDCRSDSLCAVRWTRYCACSAFASSSRTSAASCS